MGWRGRLGIRMFKKARPLSEKWCDLPSRVASRVTGTGVDTVQVSCGRGRGVTFLVSVFIACHVPRVSSDLLLQ